MADAQDTTGDAIPDLAVEPPDAATSPIEISRRDTFSSKTASEGDSEKVDTCRICRSEGTPEEPLFYPCKCSGSIKFVHQECLMEWLSHSHKKHCELCKTPFRFTKLYDANMPQELPWRVFVRRACWHVIQLFGRVGRTLLVAFVWLGLIPWLIRWVWRWFFWVADAAWAREAFMEIMQPSSTQPESQPSNVEWIKNTFQQLWQQDGIFNRSEGPLAYALANAVVNNLGFGADNSTSASFTWPQADPSILSSWTYLASLTPSSHMNRIILDVFEGQIVTCLVITGFILVFLIREWVVQQQPLVNLDNMANAQQQLRAAAEGVQADNERFRRQQELIEQARRTLQELEERGPRREDGEESVEAGEFVGWEKLEKMIDHATEHLRKGGGAEYGLFLRYGEAAVRQIRAAFTADVDLDDLRERTRRKFATFTPEERQEWLSISAREDEKIDFALRQADGQPAASVTGVESSATVTSRPRMPERDFSSRAANIHRLLEEADGLINGATGATESRGSQTLRTSPKDDTSSVEAVSGSTADNEPPIDIVPTNDSAFKDAQPVQDILDPMPITNAGPDAKINIKRSGRGKMRAVPEPKIEEKMLADDEAKRKLEDEVTKELEQEMSKLPKASSNHIGAPQGSHTMELSDNSSNSNPFHPDGPEPERRNSESFSNRVASVFREEFGLDEAEEVEIMRQPGIEPEGETAPDDEQAEETRVRQPADRQPTYIERLSDWFWGDIRSEGAQEDVPAPNEELQQVDAENEGQEAPFVPVQPDPPAIADPLIPAAAQPEHPHHDPEVVAAAQQAGLDPEALEEAEDLEGIFELIGLQGPLIGLFQTSAFCTLLVGCTIICAVVLPYIGGKMMLNLIGSPVYFLVKMPLQAASFTADLLIDLTLMLAGWSVTLLALVTEVLLSVAQMMTPRIGSVGLVEKVGDYASTVAANSGTRLHALFTPSEPTDALMFSWAFLGSSVHAHASLRTIQEDINAVLSNLGMVVTWIVETISTGSVCKQLLSALRHVSELHPRLLVRVDGLQQYTHQLIEFFSSLSRGALTFSNPEIPLDPSLVYWNSWDRALAILTGYTALAALAAVYVALDTPITKSESGRNTEKIIRDSLRQAGGVLKVILIISIEMLVFPLYCGLLLDVAFLPLFKSATVASRWEFAGRHPYTFCFVHWFVGTCYMFHFALFVSMCRKILRKGVLWFIRDPDDPTFHPVRDVLERNVATQLRKIAFSALVYGALVILCLGGVIWTIGRLFEGIFPIHWISTEPVLEFPLDLFLYNFVTPLIVRLFKPSDAVNVMYAWWLRRCARVLRLSHFLFDDRRKDEEGHVVRNTWASFFLMKRPDGESRSQDDAGDNREKQVYFEPDGKYVLTPCNDQYRPPKPGEAYLHADDHDVYIADKDGKKNEHFAKVYVPPLFRLRITAFMICLWMFSAFMGLCATLVPLVFGRCLFALIMPAGVRVNDIYAYSAGAYILGGALFGALKGRTGASYFKDKVKTVDLKAWIDPVKRFTLRVLKCAYVYGFIGVVLPIIFALILQFYCVLPLHTWFVSTTASLANQMQMSNSTEPASTPGSLAEGAGASQTQWPTLTEHTIHVLQDYALGLLYVRIAGRFLIAAPASRAAEAFRRITADGYLNPNVRLATRFFVLPVTLATTILLLIPPLAAKLSIVATSAFSTSFTLDAESETKLYRYSYPLAASFVVLVFGVVELGKATSRWRARIRDEVYLVGERLHNFGEKKPPSGSKSVVRKEI